MSSSDPWPHDRRRLLVALGSVGLLGLTGACGFRPAYAPGGTGRALQGQLRAADPVTRADFQFLAALEDRLGRPESARFDLDYRITTDRIEGGRIQGLGATRIVLAGRLDYTLAEAGLERTRGQVAAETAYSNTATQLAAQTAGEDAELRLMRMLADALVTRLLGDPALARS